VSRDALRRLLSPLWPLYALGADARRRLYDHRLLPVHETGVPVLSVGNLTVGGTGKTPLTRAIVRDLLDRGERPAILLRGYGGRGSTEPVPTWVETPPAGALDVFGDEALGHARALPGVLVRAHPDRVDAARRAVAAGATVLVCDDAFQHRRLARDVDVVCLDWTAPLDDGRLLPAGLLREPVAALGRADVLFWTRVPSSPGIAGEGDRARVRAAAGEIPEVRWAFEPGAIRRAGSREPARVREVVLLSGIGRPEGYLATATAAGLRVADAIAFPDHHRFDAGDLDRAEARRRELGADAILLTEKDEVRIPAGTRNGRLAILELACRPLDPVPDLLELCREARSPRPRPGDREREG